MNSKNILVGAILLCVSVIGGVFGGSLNKTESVGGLYNTNPTQFINGFSAGTSNQFAVTSAGAVTTGALSSSAVTSTGEVNIFGNAATSTIQVGGASKSGCLILGSNVNGATPLYVTANVAGTALVLATTTVPAACQTAQ